MFSLILPTPVINLLIGAEVQSARALIQHAALPRILRLNVTNEEREGAPHSHHLANRRRAHTHTLMTE